jgi:hypothetical protein
MIVTALASRRMAFRKSSSAQIPMTRFLSRFDFARLVQRAWQP